jgi:hypothetical protein
MRVVDYAEEGVLDEDGADGGVLAEAKRHHRHES